MFPGKTPRPDAAPTNDKSFDEPSIKKRKYFKPDQHKLLENEELTESDPEVKDFMQKYWGSIRSFTKKGKIQNIFNIFYDRDFKDLIEAIAERIMAYQKNRFKINYSLGFILKNLETKELRYYHASFNNAQMLETALLINNRKDLINFFNSLAEESFYDGLTRPDTKWKVVQISNITFYANNLKDAPLGAGASLPSYITNNHGLANVSGNDNLCFFRCVAVHRGSGRWWWRCEREAKKLFNDYCMHFNIVPNTFVGVNLVDFIDLEDFFKINLVVYELEEGVAKLIQRSRELYSETMRLNIWKNHLSLIVDFERYCRVYQCIHCGKLWDQNNNYYRHTKTCKTTVRDLFPGGIHKNPATVFEKLEEIGICVPANERFFPYFACYDFEAYFSQEHLPGNGPKLSFEARHVPLSVGIATNVPNFENGVCFVTNGNENDLVEKMLKHLEDASNAAYEIMKSKFDYVFQALELSENVRKENLTKEFEAYCRELIVIGFNSASYDLNLIKPTLIQQLLGKIDFVIKKANNYLCIKTEKLRFLDIRHFLAPGFSYRKFLIAYGSVQTKFYFPYEFMTDLTKLQSGLPDHQAFYSSLTKSNISKDEYELVKKTWIEKGWHTLKDMLIYYNMLDCVPFITAVKNLLHPYKEQGLDIFKRAFSVSGVAKLQMMKRIEKETFFCLFPKRHADLYNTMRNQITGGLSIVFTRLAIAGETKIRSHEIDNPEPVKQVLGLDANSLYLHAIAQNNPTGYFCRYKEEENFRPDPCSKFGLQAYQWLSYVSQTEEKFIQSRYNMGEQRVSTHSLPVDGFCQESNQVFQFLGCFWHSCTDCNTNRNSDGSLQEMHPVKKIPHSEVRKATLENKRRLEAEGFDVVEMRECRWKQLAKRNDIAAYLKTLKSVQPKRQLSFQKILEGVKNGTLYGFLLVDIHTPNHLKEKYKDFPLIIKNTCVSRDDIGDYMRNVAEEHGLLKKPKKYLISSHFGKEILINTEMAKFYLEMGLEITKIKEFIEFYPQKCFAKLADEIVNSRRAADTDPSKAVIALTNKLTGNSLYSASLLNKAKHRNITYHSEKTVNRVINDPHFIHLDEIGSDLYEVKSLKHKIRHDLPVQIGINVYLNSKLHMLKFFYLFLKKYIPDRCFEMLESDTDSMYFSLSRESLDDCVPEELKTSYFRDKLIWMPAEACPNHEEQYIECRSKSNPWTMEQCCLDFHSFDKRSLGKMKVEYKGTAQVSLTSKSYFCSGETKKQVCKGVSIFQNPLSFEQYVNVLKSNTPLEITNCGFRSRNHQVFSYKQHKKGLNSFYPKRIVLDDGIHTLPLDL